MMNILISILSKIEVGCECWIKVNQISHAKLCDVQIL